MKRELLDFLKMNEVEYQENLCLRKYSSVKIGGIASVVIFPDTVEKMITAIDFLWKNKIDYKIFGRLTNVLIADDPIFSVIIKTDNIRGVYKYDGRISLYAGERLSSISYKLASQGIDGFCELSGIPGSIGGMIKNNAGAFGVEVSDIIESAVVYSPDDGESIILNSGDMKFEYRDSIFMHESLVILYADFKIKQNDPKAILSKITELKERRCKSQPLSYPSLGSVFKKLPFDSASRIIDEAGLKGLAIGGAQISEKHAGFIINKGNASFEDYKKLLEYVKRTVYDKYGVSLIEEIEIYKGK